MQYRGKEAAEKNKSLQTYWEDKKIAQAIIVYLLYKMRRKKKSNKILL